MLSVLLSSVGGSGLNPRQVVLLSSVGGCGLNPRQGLCICWFSTKHVAFRLVCVITLYWSKMACFPVDCCFCELPSLTFVLSKIDIFAT